ncbi:MAG: haloacid dehalogenase-like hydrolase [Labilithrix sp.]|nr:haloacid dehalogenase-like hydrolase [Labilithrix sp.]
MTPLAALPVGAAAGLTGLLFDLDDTVLTHGVLTREAYEALWSMHEAGLALVAVTGRPSGWGEVVARQWPIDGAVTENGAVHVVREGMRVRVIADGTDREVAARRARLEALVTEVSARLPDVKLADDNLARRSDVTWDIGENDRQPPVVVAELQRLILAAGARTTRSSVHVHATYERDDKATGAVRFLVSRFGADAGAARTRWAFVGDSGNDAACFAGFVHTFGVANVRPYAGSLSVPPRWITSAERGAGFAELARTLVSARRAAASSR